ncbi:MAG: ABC transporter permease [Lachnospiraceae bacterium]|nr:ABC transporter permease [Lachnospiraceae bacterium]
MNSIFIYELKLNLKTLIIWSLAVGGMGLVCILLYKSMQGDMKEMADAFSNMGAFSDAFGMSTLSIVTLKGYFATEVGTVHGIGSGMFAAIIAIGIISKEEEMHSGEFLLSLPVSRNKVVLAKSLSVLIMLVLFTLICSVLYVLGFVMLDEEVPVNEFVRFMSSQFLMNLEIASLCLLISAFSSKNKMGLGLGLAMILYFYDLIGRVVPDMKDYLFISPYSYANASEIFSDKDIEALPFVLALVVIVSAISLAFASYNKRDLAS